MDTVYHRVLFHSVMCIDERDRQAVPDILRDIGFSYHVLGRIVRFLKDFGHIRMGQSGYDIAGISVHIGPVYEKTGICATRAPFLLRPSDMIRWSHYYVTSFFDPPNDCTRVQTIRYFVEFLRLSRE